MTMSYRVIEVYTSEEVRCRGGLLTDAVVDYLRSRNAVSRCIITRGIGGYAESGEISDHKILALSYNQPVKIEIVLPAPEADEVMAQLQEMVCEGIIGMRDLTVCVHRTRKRLFPRQLRVADVMTRPAVSVNREEAADRIVRILLSSDFTGMPVVDGEKRPVGVVSQTDLIYRAGMPLRLALMAHSDADRLKAALGRIAPKTAGGIMTAPAVTIQESALLTEGVDLMLKREVKRLPVVDEWGKLKGMLSRMDIFQTITRESPDWTAIRRCNVEVTGGSRVAEIMRRDTHTVRPETPIAEVIWIIDADDIQRVAVVDERGALMGMISDRNLLAAFGSREPGVWDLLSRLVPFSAKRSTSDWVRGNLGGITAREVMKTELITIRQDAPVDEAISLMLQHRIKRLPVVDENGLFRGMISRESLLRIGFERRETDL